MGLKKVIITIIFLIILAVGAYSVYKIFVGGAPSSDAAKQASILPHGDSLDFSKVKEFNPGQRIFQYPTVTPDETGSSVGDIISQ